MEPVYVTIRDCRWARAIARVPPTVSSMYDLIPDTAVDEEGWLPTGRPVVLQPGTLMVRQRGDRVYGSVVMPDGTLLDFDMHISQGWASHMARTLRGIVELSHERRILAAIGTAMERPSIPSGERRRLDRLRNQVMHNWVGPRPKEIRLGFRRWLVETANSTGLTTDQVLEMLEMSDVPLGNETDKPPDLPERLRRIAFD